jgi:hypothetical protein
MKALALKELRDVSGIAAVALVAYLALVLSLMGVKVFGWVPEMPQGTEEVPFTGGSFTVFFILVSVVLATALGYRQSAWELSQGTFLLLLHRPVSRSAIFLTKLAVGAGVFLGCASVPILLYAWWSAVPGHHPGPFAWSMTEGAWRLTLLIPLLYFGAFLSGLRPARWFGTRLLPLIAALVFLVLLCNLRWWSRSLGLAAVLYGLQVSNVCYVARVRDYA